VSGHRTQPLLACVSALEGGATRREEEIGMGSTARRPFVLLLALAFLAGCGGGDSGSDSQTSAATTAAPKEPVTLTFWSWAPNISKVVKIWNASHPNIRVKVSQPAQGDALATKLITANKAGNPPDLAQAEYQALPALVISGAVADIRKQVEPIKGEFTDATWKLVSFGDAVYGVPQDTAPMMLLYRKDLFDRYGLEVPATWDEFAAAAKQLRGKDSKRYLTTFSANDPGWFAGLSQQAGGQWWNVDGETWKVGIADEATKRVADYWNGLVADKAILDEPMYTPQWNKHLNDGTLLAWPTAVWGPAVLEGIAPDTKGKWAMAPLPQWNDGEQATGFWGGSSTAVMKKSEHPAEAAQFATWLNTDPQAIEALITISNVYPAATKGQTAPALGKPPSFLPDDADFFARVAEISKGARGFTWGPDVNVTYQSYKDAFSKAIRSKSPFTGALDTMQQTTVNDMKKARFTVSE
jgi:multiple sugar transport system substrate-binding protein